jgi:hypothetical protein
MVRAGARLRLREQGRQGLRRRGDKVAGCGLRVGVVLRRAFGRTGEGCIMPANGLRYFNAQ